VVRTSWGKENYEIDSPNKNADAVEARSWITLDAAKKLLAAVVRILTAEEVCDHKRVPAGGICCKS
jgi:hypothetical protein